MPRIQPFQALRYTSKAGDPGRLVAPPYDAISASLRQALLASSPYNIVRLDYPEALPADRGDDNQYTRAAHTLDNWRRDGILARDEQSAVYLYHQTFPWAGKTYTRRSFFALVELGEEGAQGGIKPHERTLDRPRSDRIEMLRRLRVQTSPILSLYRKAAELPEPQGEPSVRALRADEEHRLWRLTDPEVIEAAIASVADRAIYIADGHHRHAAARAYRDELGAAPGEPEAFALMALAPADDLLVLPWHRLVLDRALPEDLDRRLARFFASEPLAAADAESAVAELESAEPGGAGQAARFVLLGPGAGRARRLTLRDPAALEAHMPEGRSAAWRGLDVAILATALEACLGIDASAVADGALGYTQDAQEVFAAMAKGAARAAFLLRSTRIEQLLDVADAGDVMPPKSTYLYPKLPAGLLLHAYDA